MSDFSSSNQLLGVMAPADRALLIPHLEPVALPREMVLVTPDAPISDLVFLEHGVASVTAVLADKGRTEVGIIGREGMTGMPLLMGTDRTPHETFMQVAGAGLRIAAAPLLAAVAASEPLRLLLLRFGQALFIQTGHSTAANAHHRMEARLARWLLMVHDRIGTPDIPLTHEFMAIMIAAQRSGVTVTLHILEGAGMIRSTRGIVTILDREKLADLAGDTYGVPEAEYRRLIGVPLGGAG